VPIKTDRFFVALDFVLRAEGGYNNDPDDPGGATNRGIIQREYDAYRRRSGLSLRSVKFIEQKELIEIYYTDYWLVGDCDKLPVPLDLTHFDTCVNFCPLQAAEFLQEALGITADGLIGPKTLAAVANADGKVVAEKICDERISFRYQRVKQKLSQKKYLQGWLNRDNALKRYIQNA
jgi:lysozyme family protein